MTNKAEQTEVTTCGSYVEGYCLGDDCQESLPCRAILYCSVKEILKNSEYLKILIKGESDCEV